MKIFRHSFRVASLIIVAALVLHPGSVRASATASDNAVNDNIGSGNNGGSGFAAWSSSFTGGGGGVFTGSSLVNTANHLSPGINTSSKAWGMFCSGTGVGVNFSRLSRLFTTANGSTALQVGQTFTIDLQNGNVNSGGTVGFSLQNSSAQDVFKFSFTGGQSVYQINSANPATAISFTKTGLRVTVKLTSSTAYSCSAFVPNTSGTAISNTGNLLSPAGGQSIDRIILFTDGAGSGGDFDMFFNSLGISCPTPTVTTQPNSTTVCSGSTASFSVASTTAATPIFQWQLSTNGGSTWNNVTTGTGGTTVSYTTAATVAGDNNNQYRCVVTDACGTSVNSSAAILTVNTAVSIGTQPTPQTVCTGNNATYTVAATGTGLTYQWQRNGSNIGNGGTISGSATATLTLTGVTAGDSGATYDVVVSGTAPCSPVTSTAAALTVSSGVSISGQPTDQTACSAPGTASFTVTATGAGLTYQWRKNSSNLSNGGSIANATTATLSLSSLTAADTVAAASGYDCVVSSTCGSPVTSSRAALTVSTAVSISAGPTSVTKCVGDSVTFTVTASGTGLTYQWRKNGVNIGGATSSSYTISPVAIGDAASSSGYDCVVSGTAPCASATSSAATLTVNSSPSVTVPPSSQTACSGSTVSFTVTVTGTSLTYQWRKGGSNLSNGGTVSGATTTTLTLTGVVSGDSGGSFDVVVSGASPCSPATSTAATLTVNTAAGITTAPSAQTICQGGTATFTVTASGTTPSYAWRKRVASAGWGTGNQWQLNPSGSGSFFRQTSLQNNNGGANCANGSDIGVAWAIFNGDNTAGSTARRTFPNTLQTGQYFQIDMDNGSVDSGKKDGFSLRDSSNTSVFDFYFLGGQANYKYTSGGVEQDTGIAFSRNGLTIRVTLTSAGFTLAITPCSGSTSTFTGTLASGGAISQTVLYNNNNTGGDPHNLYFNNIIAGTAEDNASNYTGWSNGDNFGIAPISGATSASYLINNAQTTDSGSYDVVVWNSCGGETFSSAASLTVNPTPNLGLTETDVTCNSGSDGKVTATFSGGVGTLQVKIDGGSYATQTSPFQFTGLTAGSHTVSVQDATTLCSSNLTITVNQPSAPVTFTFSQVNNATCGAAGGSITVTPAGGSGSGYTYSTNNGASFTGSGAPFTFSGLVAGAYSVVVRDSVGCVSGTTVVTITDPGGPSLGLGQTPATCNGGSDGQVTATFSGGTGPYQVKIDAGSYTTQTSPYTFTGLGAGSHTITVKDNNGCTTPQVITVTQPTAVTFGTSQVNETCNGGSTGSITVTSPSGGSGTGYTYSKDNGATFQAGTTFSSLAAGTYQIKVKDSVGCVSAATGVTITQPTAVTFSTTQVNETCNGGATGSITVTSPSGGSGSGYTYSTNNGVSFQGGATFSSVPAGTYQVVVKDSAGCVSAPAAVTITQPTAITFSTTSLPGGTSQSAYSQTISASGGTGAITYSTSSTLPTGITLSFAGVLAGTPTQTGTFPITVQAKDASNCTANQSLSLVISCSTITVSPTSLPFGITNASYSVTNNTIGASGGTGPYTFAVTTGTLPAGLTLSSGGVVSGTPTTAGSSTTTVTATDANGCTGTQDYTITIGLPVVITTQPAPAMACSGTTANFTVAATGSSPLSYAWRKNGVGWGTGNAWAFNPTTCNGANDGYYIGDSTACGGISPGIGTAYGIYSANGNFSEVTRQFSALQVGQSVVVDYQNPASMSSTGAGTIALFSLRDSSGSARFEFYFNGGESYYTINDSNTLVNASGIPFTASGLHLVFTLVTADTYNLQVTRLSNTNNYTFVGRTLKGTAGNALSQVRFFYRNSDTGGTACQDFFFNVGTSVGGFSDNAANYSSGACGSTTWTNGSNNGQGPLTDAGSISGSATATLSLTNVSSADSGSIYSVVVYNPYGALKSGTGVLTVNSLPNLSLSETDVSCNGGSDGQVAATFSNGTGVSGALQVNIDGGSYSTQTSPYSFTGLAPGSHTVTVQDVNGCTSNLTITVNQPTAVTFTTSQVNETCNGGTTGSITVTPSGGSGSGYTYSQDNGATFQAGNQFTGLAAGTYNIVVKDGNGCLSSSSAVTITQPTAVTSTSSQVNETCNGQSIGSITVTPSGGSGSGYTYSQDNGANFQAGNQFTGLGAGTYQIVVKDGAGCVSSATGITISQPTAVSFNTSQVNEMCNGQSIGSITVTTSGGSGAGYTYSKDNGATFQAGNQFTGLAAGTYQILVKDGAGCLSSTTVVTITQPAVVMFTTSQVNETCNGQSIGSITVTASGGSGTYTYSKDNGATFQTGATFSSLAPGAYQIVVKDNNGCLSSSSSVTITEPTAISLSLGETDVSCNGGSNGTVTATFSGGTGTLQVNINGGAYSAQGSPYTFTGLSAGSNTVSVQDANGCTTSQSIMVNQPAAPPVTASSDAPFYGGAYQIVQGQTLHLSATTVANATSYNWSRDGGSTFATGQNVSDVPPAGTHVYTVTVPTSCGTAVGSTPSIIVLTADGSGVPDQWKTEHGYSASTPSFTVGANGMTLLQSYLAGVDPNDPSSTFTIQSVSVTPAGVVTVQWNSTQDGTTPTRNYDVYATTNYFTGAGWSRIASNIAPQGASTFYSDATDNGVTLKFYRITIAGTTQAVTLNVAALQNLTLLEGRNYISMSSLPGTSTLLGVLGTNQLPQGAFEAQATVAEVWDQMNQNFGNMSAPNIYYLGTGSSGWKQDTTATPTNNALLDPNKGIIVTIRPGQGTQTVRLTGFVPTNNQIQTVQSNGYTVASSTFPNVVSLNANVGGDGSGLIGSGFTGGISLSHSDNLLFYNPTTQLFDVRVWYDTGSQLWRNTDASVATAQLQPGQSFLIQRRTRATNFTWTNSVPYTVPLQGP